MVLLLIVVVVEVVVVIVVVDVGDGAGWRPMQGRTLSPTTTTITLSPEVDAKWTHPH